MRLSSYSLAFVVAAGFLAAGPRPAAACSCVHGPTPCEAFASSPIVFVGEVLSVEETGGNFHMRLRVVRALKGIKGTTADLWSDATSSCGVRLDEGGRYVVYTSLAGGRMSIHACGYGRRLAPGEPDPELPPAPGTSTAASRATTSIGYASSSRSKPSPRSASRSISQRA